MCTNNCFHLIVKILYITAPYCFLPILGTLLVQVLIFERGPTIFKKFNNTVCIGLCKLKCTEKRFIPFTPSIFSLSLSPIQNLKEGLNMPPGMYSTICTSLRNNAAFSLQVPSILSILLGPNNPDVMQPISRHGRSDYVMNLEKRTN
jgi:hypothetical protein